MKKIQQLIFSLLLINVSCAMGMERRKVKRSDIENPVVEQPLEKQTGLIPFHKIYHPREELWLKFDKNTSYFNGHKVDLGTETGKRLGENLLTLSANTVVLLSLLYLKTEIFDSRYDPAVLGFLSMLQICQVAGTLCELRNSDALFQKAKTARSLDEYVPPVPMSKNKRILLATSFVASAISGLYLFMYDDCASVVYPNSTCIPSHACIDESRGVLGLINLVVAASRFYKEST